MIGPPSRRDPLAELAADPPTATLLAAARADIDSLLWRRDIRTHDPVDTRHGDGPSLTRELGLDRTRKDLMVSEEVCMRPAVTFVLINGVVTEIDRISPRTERSTIGEIIDADFHAAAGAGLSFGVSTESEKGEQSEPRGALGEKGNLHDDCFIGV